jgi:hypothetical protein
VQTCVVAPVSRIQSVSENGLRWPAGVDGDGDDDGCLGPEVITKPGSAGAGTWTLGCRRGTVRIVNTIGFGRVVGLEL